MFTKFAYSPAYCQTGILENNSLISNVFPNIDTVSDIWFLVFGCSADIVQTFLILFNNRIIHANDRMSICFLLHRITSHAAMPHLRNLLFSFYSFLIWRPQSTSNSLHGQFIWPADSRTRSDPFSSLRTFDTDPTMVTITSNAAAPTTHPPLVTIIDSLPALSERKSCNHYFNDSFESNKILQD
jgi:hypothetical protein